MAVGRKTGGREKGTPNKRTVQRAEAVRDAADKLSLVLPNGFEGDSHAFLMAVYKDPSQAIEVRLDAAKACINYEKPRLASIQHGGSIDGGAGPLVPVLNVTIGGSDKKERL